MKKKNYYMIQCLLTKKDDLNGNKMMVSWLPENFAVKGRVLNIKNDKSEWEDGWVVDTVYTHGKLDMEQLMLLSPQYRDTRKASDI